MSAVIRAELNEKTGRIRIIEGVKPLITINGYSSSHFSTIGEEFVSLRYFAVCGTTGYIVEECHETSRNFHEYNLLDRETAIVFFNMMESACFETYTLPMIKQNKLLKRFNKQVSLLEKIQPGITDESDMTGACSCCCCEDECEEEEAEMYYEELEKERREEELIDELCAKYYEIAKNIIDECDKAIFVLNTQNTSDELKAEILSKFIAYMENQLKNMYTNIFEDAGYEENVMRSVTDYITEFVHKYRSNLCLL